MWLGIPKPMISYPLLGQGVVRPVGSHLAAYSSVWRCLSPPPPPPRPVRSPTQTPSHPPHSNPSLSAPLLGGGAPKGWGGGVVGVQTQGVAPPPPLQTPLDSL